MKTAVTGAKNPAFENIAIRIAIRGLTEFESVHLTLNRIK